MGQQRGTFGNAALQSFGVTGATNGSFSTIGGQPRHTLAALDAATGKASAWSPNPDSIVLALDCRGRRCTRAGASPRWTES